MKLWTLGLCFAVVALAQVSPDEDAFPNFSIRLSEGYAAAFMTSGQFALTSGPPIQGPTGFIIRFSNVPNGVRLRVPWEVRSATLGLRARPDETAEFTGIIKGDGSVVYEVVNAAPSLVEYVTLEIFVELPGSCEDARCVASIDEVTSVSELGVTATVLVMRLPDRPKPKVSPTMTLVVDRREQRAIDVLPNPEPDPE